MQRRVRATGSNYRVHERWGLVARIGVRNGPPAGGLQHPALPDDYEVDDEPGAARRRSGGTTVIVRVSRAVVRPGRERVFRERLLRLVSTFASQHGGLLGWEVWTAEEGQRCVFVSRWVDEAAVAAFAGPGWAGEPVTFPGEEDDLLEPLRVDHYRVDTLWTSA